MTTRNILHVASEMMRHAKPTPPSACKGRIVLTLLMLLLTMTSQTAWADVTISSATDWDTFASNVSNGTTYSGEIVTLANDITVTTMVGDADHKFSGTFYGGGHTLTFNATATGDGCAPFFAISGATFTCLKVAGTISTGYKFAAGIAAYSYGDCIIQSCRSSVVISSSISGDGTHAGFVAVQQNGSLTVSNCLMDGSITGSNTTNCGGFVGWRNGTLTFNNCLMAGTLGISLDSNSATFNRNGWSTLNNCYYKGTYTNATLQGDATTATGSTLQTLLGSGWQVSGNSVVVPDMNGNNLATATVSGINQLYIRNGSEVIQPEPTVVACDGTPLTKGTHYTVVWSGNGTVDGDYTVTVTGMSPYYGSQTVAYTVKSTETLGGYDFRLGLDNDGLYYMVDCPAALNALSAYVQSNNCSGKRFVQTADITLTGTFTPIGGNSGQSDGFSGIYDGGGHTISGLNVSVTSSSWSSSAQAGLFGKVKNGMVRNVGLIAPSVSCSTSKLYNRAGAIAGYVEKSSSNVTHCFVINPGSITASGGQNNYAGLFFGHGNDAAFSYLYYYGPTSLPMSGHNSIGSNHIEQIYKVTAGTNVGLPATADETGFIAGGSHYYRQGATVPLSYTGSNPNHYRPVYSVTPAGTGTSVSSGGVLTMGNADIAVSATLSSVPLTDISTATVAAIADQQWTGSTVIPTGLTVKVGTKTLVEGTDYSVSTDGRTTGTATATITGQGDYYGTVTKTFRIVKSGSCGTSATYLLTDTDNNGSFDKLEIGGTGAMTDYAGSDARPWNGDAASITSLTIGSGITHIGDYTFFKLDNFTQAIVIPEGVASIGNSAFEVSRYIPSVTIPASVTSIGINAFHSCGTWVSGFTLTTAVGSLLSSIALNSFMSIQGTIDLGTSSLTTIPKEAFYCCYATVILPASVTTIEEKAFRGGADTPHIYVAVPTGFTITANGVALTIEDGMADIKSVVNPSGSDSNAVTVSVTPDPAHFELTATDEYTIKTATGWDVFCEYLSGGETFSGKTVKLGADIPTAAEIAAGTTAITRMAGPNPFCGNFDGGNHTLTFTATATGNYCAPFANVKGGSDKDHAITISNLNVKTTITATDFRHTAGLIALQQGHVNVTGCNADVTISSTGISNNSHDLYPAALVSQASPDNGGTLTVSGCTATGTISTDGKYAAGLVGIVQGAASISDCVSSVTIDSSTSGDGTHGGIIAALTGTANIYGTVFNGKLLGSDTEKVGGFIGWRNAVANIYNSLFIPTEVTVKNDYSATFARNVVDTYNCYYTTLLCDGTNYVPSLENTNTTPYMWHNGHAPLSILAGENVTISDISPVGEPTSTDGYNGVYTVSGITAYAKGITRTVDDVTTFYYGQGDDVSLTLGYTGTVPVGQQAGYEATSGTISGNDTDGYVLTLGEGDATINAKCTYYSGYYVVGSMTEWQISPDYLLAANPEAEGEYMILGVTLTDGDEFKVIWHDAGTGNWTWFPADGGNYAITADGTYDIYFRPDYQGGDDWHCHCIYAQKQTPEVTEGDANGDGSVDIADVTAIINYINNDAPASFNAEAADVNKDGTIDIGDVTGVINTINNKR